MKQKNGLRLFPTLRNLEQEHLIQKEKKNQLHTQNSCCKVVLEM